jgi:tetratricopeptide (TPR) repeat protein
VRNNRSRAVRQPSAYSTVGNRHIRCRHVAFLLCASIIVSACAPGAVRHNNTGNERFVEGAYSEAIAAYRRAQVEDPELAQPYYNAANAYNRQAQLGAALFQAQQALKSADPGLAAATWYNLGNALFDAQQWPEAIAAYQSALRIDPDDRDAKHNLELALQRYEEQEQASEQTPDQQTDTDRGEKKAATSDQPEDAAATRTSDPQSAPPDKQEQATPEPTGEGQAGGRMSPEQARQMLDALIGTGETLQERLHKTYWAPALPPRRDW